jgi:hypothetical protein
VWRQILISAKLRIGKRGHKTELIGRSALGKGGSALDCTAIEGGEGGGGEGEEAYASTFMVGILHMIKTIIMKIKCCSAYI